MANLTVDDVKKELSPQDYETLSLGDDTVATRCLLRAKISVKGMILSTGNAYDEDNEVCRQAVLTRTVYELFSFVGQSNRAKEKQADCELLIESYYGPIIKKNDNSASSETGPAYGVMKKSGASPIDRRRF